MDDSIISAKNVHKIYGTGSLLVNALNGIDMEVGRGEMIAIMGPSGCGKTTLLNCLSGLDSINSGNIFVDQQPIHDLSDDKMSEFRAKSMGFIFQTYNLLPVLTARENVEMPLLISGISSKEAANQANEQLEAVGLLEWSTHKPGELSGGQRQRVAIARALVNKPAIVWADEPTGNLDSNNENEIMELLSFTNSQYNQTIVLVTHSDKVAAKADRIVRMEDGIIVNSG
ncbi:MAG: macrolide ABC transporter ATP-binding protein [Anaerolineaceae bacterium]|nr:macrolide ABC transporter ATP-binding protein [Anaerolineaceae bacterium]|tara:strand:+ start:76 stop:759 length:684 start_codon:yes stop_codon:yes gene_type:complete